MKTYENNMADQDVVVHSLRVLTDVKSPALSQLKRDLNTQQVTSQALARKQEKFYKSLSDDGIISPMEKKIVQREMESIATSYTALYQQAVAEHYEQAAFFQDYMATYAALRDYIYSDLHLFDNMDEDTEVDRDQFNEFFSDYYYSENTAIVSMTVGVITEMGFKVLTSLEDEGEDGQVGIYHGALYQYIDQQWKPIDRELYYGKSETLPPAMDGRYFLCTKNVILTDILYVNDEPLEVNGEALEIGDSYEKGVIYVYEDYHWQAKDPEEDYRYIVAMGDYYLIKEVLPAVFKTEVENIARVAAGSTYYGALLVPPVNPQENDFFLYAGQTSGETPPRWVFASLYMYKSGNWVRLDETIAQNQKYYMEALQDILTITESTSGYFSTVFCNAFFTNQAAMNSLSTQVIVLRTNGALKSENYEANTAGLLIDSDGNIDANGNTHIGASSSNKVAIGVPLTDSDLGTYDVVIGGNAKVKGDMEIGGNTVFRGKIDTDKECYAAGFELRGLKPGNNSLRNLGVTDGSVYWQIPASGTIRFAGAVSAVGGSGGWIYVYLNGVTLYNTMVGNGEAAWIDFNITVSAGDTIGVYTQGAGGGAIGFGVVTFNGGLYTSTKNSLVSFLGQLVSSPNPPCNLVDNLGDEV